VLRSGCPSEDRRTKTSAPASASHSEEWISSRVLRESVEKETPRCYLDAYSELGQKTCCRTVTSRTRTKWPAGTTTGADRDTGMQYSRDCVEHGTGWSIKEPPQQSRNPQGLPQRLRQTSYWRARETPWQEPPQMDTSYEKLTPDEKRMFSKRPRNHPAGISFEARVRTNWTQASTRSVVGQDGGKPGYTRRRRCDAWSPGICTQEEARVLARQALDMRDRIGHRFMRIVDRRTTRRTRRGQPRAVHPAFQGQIKAGRRTGVFQRSITDPSAAAAVLTIPGRGAGRSRPPDARRADRQPRRCGAGKREFLPGDTLPRAG